MNLAEVGELRNDLLKNEIDSGVDPCSNGVLISLVTRQPSINLRQSCLMDTEQAITNGLSRMKDETPRFFSLSLLIIEPP